MDGLKAEGFYPTWAAQCQSRKGSSRAHSKHMLRFRHIDAVPTREGLYPELVLINSHDGLSSYRLMSGIYRMVCSNGLIAGQSYNEVRVRHQGDILHDVIEGTYRVIDNAQKMLTTAEVMQQTKLDSAEQLALANAAHHIRFEGKEAGQAFEVASFLEPRRFADNGHQDLFTIFNILQENIIKGGVRGYTRKHRRYYPTRTRGISSIDTSTKINKLLWSSAENMLIEKGQKAA